MAADISSIMQLLQRQAALVPPAYSTVSSPHQPPGPPPCPLQPVLPITPIQPLSQVSTRRTPNPPKCGAGPGCLPAGSHYCVFQLHRELGALLSPPRLGLFFCPILQPRGELGTWLSPQLWGSPSPVPHFPSTGSQ